MESIRVRAKVPLFEIVRITHFNLHQEYIHINMCELAFYFQKKYYTSFNHYCKNSSFVGSKTSSCLSVTHNINNVYQCVLLPIHV
jgi:hypothetical protein